MMAVDFISIETVWLQRLYVLFFIEIGAAGCTSLAARCIPTASG